MDHQYLDGSMENPCSLVGASEQFYDRSEGPSVLDECLPAFLLGIGDQVEEPWRIELKRRYVPDSLFFRRGTFVQMLQLRLKLISKDWKNFFSARFPFHPANKLVCSMPLMFRSFGTEVPAILARVLDVSVSWTTCSPTRPAGTLHGQRMNPRKPDWRTLVQRQESPLSQFLGA